MAERMTHGNDKTARTEVVIDIPLSEAGEMSLVSRFIGVTTVRLQEL